MTETLAGMGSLEKTVKKTASAAEAEQAAVRELVKAARGRGEVLDNGSLFWPHRDGFFWPHWMTRGGGVTV